MNTAYIFTKVIKKYSKCLHFGFLPSTLKDKSRFGRNHRFKEFDCQ